MISTNKIDMSASQLARVELMEWFDNASPEDQKVCIVTYAGLLQEMINIYNTKTESNGERKFAEFSKNLETDNEHVQPVTPGEYDIERRETDTNISS